ncbi:MAG: Lrp/AsnC family transcriptional regulator [Coriobacteriia bacterium]|nr:Lrp/AsnC family transcriptional regulator [Coriobacteriia bacterium]
MPAKGVTLDDIDRKLISGLQDDARCSYAELGRQIGLSAPAVAERMRRLEASGIVTGYHASIDLKKAGFGIVAFVRLSSPPDLAPQLERLATETPEVLEFDRVTGTEGYVMKLAVTSIEHLERIVVKFLPYGQTTTSIVLSSPVTWRKVPV